MIIVECSTESQRVPFCIKIQQNPIESPEILNHNESHIKSNSIEYNPKESLQWPPRWWCWWGRWWQWRRFNELQVLVGGDWDGDWWISGQSTLFDQYPVASPSSRSSPLQSSFLIVKCQLFVVNFIPSYQSNRGYTLLPQNELSVINFVFYVEGLRMSRCMDDTSQSFTILLHQN